jgi:hypothetical protein
MMTREVMRRAVELYPSSPYGNSTTEPEAESIPQYLDTAPLPNGHTQVESSASVQFCCEHVRA